MVSRATKRFWKSVAIGLALTPASAIQLPAWAQAPGTPAAISAVRDSDAGAAKPMADVEAVRKLLQEGRKALAEGDKVRAEKLARQAQALHVQMPFWENDNPEKLLADIGVKGAAPAKGATPTGDPKMLVKQGYEALRLGKLDDAQKLAQAAASNSKAKWGLFEDNPTKLMDEIQKARKSRDKVQSDKMLTDARKLYEQGKFADARNMAYKASTMHGPYAMWDMGDRPDKLISEIDAAEAKNRKVKLPPAPGTKPNDKVATKAGDKTSKPADKVATPNAMPNSVVQQVKPPAPNFGSEVKTAEVAAVDPKATTVTTAAGIVLPNAVSGVVPVSGDAIKLQAKQLMSEGKGYWQAGRLLEARAKYSEAAQCRCEWAGNEETPDRCLVELAATVMRQMDMAMTEAVAAASAEQKKACEARLTAARGMAVGFGLDCAALDSKLAAVQGQVAAVAAAAADASGMIQGQAKLEKARMELRSGQCEMARQMATDVFNGPYGMQADAAQVLRSIDVEEHNQRVLAANRGCDAAMTAYRNRDFAQAVAIFGQVDANLLPADRKAMMKEAVVTSQQRLTQVAVAPSAPTTPPTVVPAVVSGPATTGLQTTGASGLTGVQGGMPKMTAPAEGDNLAAQVQALQEIEYQRLRTEGLETQSKAMEQFKRGETDVALETLETFCKRVKATKLDAQAVGRLCRPIEAKEQSFKLLKAQKDDEVRVVRRKDDFQLEKSKEVTAEEKRQQQVKELMKQFNSLYKEGKYKEAEVAAKKAHELDPDDPATEAAVRLAEIHGAVETYDSLQKRKDSIFIKAMDDAEDPGRFDPKTPMIFDGPTVKLNKNRESIKGGIGVLKNMSDKDKEIHSKLLQPVTVSFSNVPLRQALYDLQAMKAMNIHLDTAALAAESVNPDAPVSLKVDNISMKAALNLILDQLHLRYVVQDEVLKVTTEKSARGRLEQRVFSVADLVITVDDNPTPEYNSLKSAFDRVIESQRNNIGGPGGTTPRDGKFMLPNGQQVGSSTNASMSTVPGGSAANSQSPSASGSSRQAMQDVLIKLITNTIAPDSWSAVGGSGTIDYMPIGLALVVNQTPDVQEQVADLLEALRKLQDLEVSVEVRIITLAETFFERIGLDFALNLKTDKGTSQFEPQLVTGQFKPAGQVNDFSPGRFLSGITGIGTAGGNTGNFTSDLDIPIRSSSFQYAIPPFAYPNNQGFNGGLSMGLAFLSDIQVYMFMEAAQGDRRTNVMQAPKITLFNGQTSTLNVSDQQFFVTNVNVVGFGGQIVFVPQNNPFPLGVNMTIQAVISADRRFVRLNINQQLSNIASAIVPLFPVTTFITPVFEGGAQGQPIPFTQFIQQPQISTVSIQTTVSIPDGGTVILGGLKTLSEGRNEFGPPVLSKLPYINRLFKNVGYGREAQSLLMMVTPRIIINAEEEERQTGVVSESSQPR